MDQQEERVHMKLEVMKGETLAGLERNFRKKVQLEEEAKENETQLQFNRGALYAYDIVQKIMRELEKASEIEAIKVKRFEDTKKALPEGASQPVKSGPSKLQEGDKVIKSEEPEKAKSTKPTNPTNQTKPTKPKEHK